MNGRTMALAPGQGRGNRAGRKERPLMLIDEFAGKQPKTAGVAARRHPRGVERIG